MHKQNTCTRHHGRQNKFSGKTVTTHARTPEEHLQSACQRTGAAQEGGHVPLWQWSSGQPGSRYHTCSPSPSQAHRAIDPMPKPTLQRQPSPTAENREAELSYNHLPGSLNESGTVAAGQRRAARCVLLRYQTIQCSPIQRFLKLQHEWTNVCLKRSVASRDVKHSNAECDEWENALLGQKACHGALTQTQ